MNSVIKHGIFTAKCVTLMVIDVVLLIAAFTVFETLLAKLGLSEAVATILGGCVTLLYAVYLNFRHWLRSTWLNTYEVM